MMRRLLLLAVLVSGCSFPEPEVIEFVEDTSAPNDTALGEAAVESGADSEAPDTTLPDSEADTTTSTDATDAMDTGAEAGADAKSDADAASDTRTEAGCVGADLCDCDGDLDKKPGAGCGGMDCDDGDPRRNSKVSTFLDYSPAGTSPAHAGDWDCNGTVLKEFSDGINCGSFLKTTGCTQQGYVPSNPACGTTVKWARCKSGALTNCTDDVTMDLVVKCR